MNSWYVKNLILNSEKIRSDIIETSYEYNDYSDDYYTSYNYNDNVDIDMDDIDRIINLFIDDDLYDDLLSVEIKLKQLNNQGIISNTEYSLIKFIQDNGYSINLLQEVFNKNRNTLYLMFDNVCNKIAFSLGGHFTNEGYLSYLESKYKLNKEQLDEIRGKIEK